MSTNQPPEHILSSRQFDRRGLDYLCCLTDEIRKFDKTRDGILYLKTLLNDKRGMLYFTQPSTRTFLSFLSACQSLGISPCEIRDTSTSSERKGESIDDSLRTFASYVDLIIMRTPVPGLCDRIAQLLDQTPRPVPIINAGSGPDEHPTQALLDIYTLFRSFKDRGGIEGKSVVMVGDLKRGRTVRSLSLLLTNYPKVKLIFVSPASFKIEEDLLLELRNKKVQFVETQDFRAAIAEGDAIYMTRVQDEYDFGGESKSVNYQDYYLKKAHLGIIKPDCVIMHPLPRRNELDAEIDSDPRAKYWRQERNGMWTRVALLTKVMKVDSKVLLPHL